MKVILNQNVENVGSVGEVVKVSDGFARNFLIPQGWAATATKGNIRVIELKQAKAIEQEKEARAKAEELAKRARTLQVTIEATVGEDGKLFGSVTSTEISEALVALGVAVDKKHVRVPKAIRKIGAHDIELRLYHNVRALLKVQVTSKKSAAKAAAEAGEAAEVKEAKKPKAAKESKKTKTESAA